MKKMFESFNNAINGIIDTVRTQRNMKIHLVVALVVLLLCFFFDISKYEFLILTVTITMVISSRIDKYSYRSSDRYDYKLLSSIC